MIWVFLSLLFCTIFKTLYSRLSPCRHPAIMDALMMWTAAKSQAKINYRCLTEIKSRYYGLLRTLT